MLSQHTISPNPKPRTALFEQEIEFDDFNVSAWVTAYAPRFKLGQLLLARGCAVTPKDEQSTTDRSFVCPFANAACSGCTYGDGDGREQDLKLVCGASDCNERSLAEKIHGFLQSGHIALSDLHDLRYLGGPLLPRGFLCEPFRSSGAIFATGLYYNARVRNRVELADDLRRVNSIVVEKIEADKPIDGLMEVCDYVRVAARTCDENGNNWGYRLEFFSRDGSLTRVDVSEDLVNARGNQLFSMLAKVGLRVAPTGQAAFRTLLTSWRTKQKIVVFSRPGWHADNTIFACPTGKIVFADEARTDKHRFDLHLSARTAAASQAVDHTSGWIEHVVKPIWTGDTDQFALGFLTGCSGVLSSLVGESFGIHFSGRTTIGKSTAQIIGAGCVADPAPGKGILFTADMTASELDAARVTATATCLHIEDSKTGGLNVEKLAYVGASGEWDLPFTISSEQPLSDIVGEKMTDGLTVRLCTVDFETIPPIEVLRASAIKRAALRHHSCLLPRFVRHVMDKSYNEQAAILNDEITAVAVRLCNALPMAAKAEWHRAAIPFAVLQVTGNLLVDLEIIPADAGQDAVARVVGWAWRTYVDGRRGRDRFATSFAALAEWLQHCATGEVQPLATGRAKERVKAWIGSDDIVYLRTKVLPTIPGVSMGEAAFIKAIKDRGLLITGRTPSKNLAWTDVPGHKHVRHYRIKVAQLRSLQSDAQ